MTRSQLIKEISDETGIPRNDIKAVVNPLFNIITKKLAVGEKIKITGFGTFIPYDLKPKMAWDPKKREKIYVPEKKTIKFKASSLILPHQK